MYMLIHRSVTSQSDVYKAQNFQVDCNALYMYIPCVHTPQKKCTRLWTFCQRQIVVTLKENDNSNQFGCAGIYMCVRSQEQIVRAKMSIQSHP